MVRGKLLVAERSSARRRRPARARAAVVSGLVPVLAVAVIAGGRQPGSALLAGAATQSGTAASGPSLPPTGVPDGFHRPGEPAMRSPASVSSLGTRLGQTSVQGIPGVALAAYQQAAAVIDTAAPSCHLDWTLLAAVGQVESDHGRVDGSSLDHRGVATPRIVGPPLDGRHGTAVVRDTDAGRLDRDGRYDHAVGPLQFLPSTWAVVAVDGDGDGRRNVQDVNDAALGAAVYLCAGHDDLETPAGARVALLRYNHSTSYVATVLAIAHGLQTSGLFAPVTSRTVSDVTPARPPASGPTDGHTTTAGPPPIVVTDPVPPSVPTTSPSTGPSEDPSPSPTPSPTPGPTPSPSPSPSGWPEPSPTTLPSSTGHPIPRPTGSTTPAEPTPSGPTATPTEPGPSTSPTGVPEPPVIPEPLPARLADLTPAQVAAFDTAWPACLARLPDVWTRRDVRRILAEDLALSRHDPALRAFAHWVDRHEHPVAEPAGRAEASADPTRGRTAG